MRGHEPLVSMRLAGHRPRSVWISLFPVQSWALEWAEWEPTQGDCTIELDTHDIAIAARLDLRFLVGLDNVTVSGPDSESTTRIAQACTRAGAKRVLAAYIDISNPGMDVIRLTDSQKEPANG